MAQAWNPRGALRVCSGTGGRVGRGPWHFSWLLPPLTPSRLPNTLAVPSSPLPRWPYPSLLLRLSSGLLRAAERHKNLIGPDTVLASGTRGPPEEVSTSSRTVSEPRAFETRDLWEPEPSPGAGKGSRRRAGVTVRKRLQSAGWGPPEGNLGSR